MKQCIRVLTLCLAVLPALSSAQENAWLDEPPVSHFNPGDFHYSGKGPLIKEAKFYLFDKVPALKQNANGLKITHQKESLMGQHLTFVQTYAGVPVFGTSVKLNLSGSHVLTSLFHKTASTASWQIEKFRWQQPDSFIRTLTGFEGQLDFKPVIYFDGKKAASARQVLFYDDSAGINRSVIYDSTGKVLYERDRNLYFTGPDTTVTAQVYYPNPLKSAGEDYGPPYVDNQDANSPVLSKERYRVRMQVNKPEQDTFFLEGPYARISNFFGPITSRGYSLEGQFDYKRDSAWFEKVNAYYHITRFQEYMQTLGVYNTADYAIPIDVHATVQDQSWFSRPNDTNVGRLYFGDGGVDDAEDASVIIHEYAHALSGYAAPRSNLYSHEAESLEEGLADYFDCS